MKTEFLKSLGIEDQSVIDKIMAENGKDINAAKKTAEGFASQIEDLKNQISERDGQLKDLKESAKDNATLTAQIEKLQSDNKEAKAAYENKIADMQKTYAIESAVRDAKAKNVKAVMALLDSEKIVYKDGEITGLNEQIKSLTEGEDTSFLFGETKPTVAGATPNDNPNDGKNGGNNPPTGNRAIGGMGLAEGIAAAFKSKTL